MLHLDIQKDKEAMKTSGFQKYIGGTAACMKRLPIVIKGCGQLTQNYTYFDDSWFSGVKNADEAMNSGVDYFGPVNMSHKGFCLATLENLMNDCPGGSYLVMKSYPIVPGGRPLLPIGYKENYRRVLIFIDNERAGNTEPGDTYLYRFPEIYSNVSVRPFVCPHLLVRYFNSCNAIDNQNRMRQYDLELEKYWVTQSGYFRLETTVVLGMGIIDGKLLYYCGVAEGNVDRKTSTLEYNIRTFYDCFNYLFTDEFGSPYLNLPSITFDYRNDPNKISRYC